MSFVGCWTWSYMKYLNFRSVLYSPVGKWFWFLLVWPSSRKFAGLGNPGFKIRLYESCLHEQEEGVGSSVSLARLRGHQWLGPLHPPGLHSSSKNISASNKRQNRRERAAAVLRSQMNLSGCQGRNLGSPPFSSSLSLCMEMDLPWVIC